MVLALSACTAPKPGWQHATVPADLKAVTHCGDKWYVVGSYHGTSPAAFASRDARTWTALTLAPSPGSYYGPRSVLYSVACANGRIAAIGAQAGGAHGNPRTSTWFQRSDTVLAEVAAPFELYGGDEAVDASRIAGGSRGFLITGNRTTGPAAWLSPHGAGFTRVQVGERGPLARDGIVLDDRWLVVGGSTAWSSSDGRAWVPSACDADEVQRVVAWRGQLVLAGVRGTSYVTWLWRDGVWRELGSFGRATPTGLRSLTVVRGRLVAAAGKVWESRDGRSWRELRAPAEPVAAAGSGDTLLLISGFSTYLR